jgi:hypothetical protein
MNRLTSQQRKLVYFAAILVLVVPIIWLGMPGSRKANADQGEGVAGGKLSSLRAEYELGESNLGDVDPSSATMNLVLVGLRGIAVNLLWVEAHENQKTKNWAQLKTNVDSIILLQPHYVGVWQFQGWNLAYNVSSEWDLISDKFYWVKEGAKFTIRGSKRNTKYPELYYWTGQIIGDKIGRHDAWRYFRKFFNPGAYDPTDDPFVGDPDLKRTSGGKIGPDPDLNPTDIDNYLASKKWMHLATDRELIQAQHIMMRALFREKPAHAQLSYADALQKEGRYETESDTEEMSRAWQIATQELTDKYQNGKTGYGRELFETTSGQVRLEADTDEQLRKLTLLDNPPGKFTIEQKRREVVFYQNVTNYRYWRTRAEVEQQPGTIQAHRDLFKGKAALMKSEPAEAIQQLKSGLLSFAHMIDKYPVLLKDDSTVEEIMIGILAWQYAYKLVGRQAPEPVPSYPPKDLKAFNGLKSLWIANQKNLKNLRKLFNRELQIQE